MLRTIPAALALLTLAACDTAGGGGSTDVVSDPSPQATPVESVTEPTDGFENEISAE